MSTTDVKQSRQLRLNQAFQKFQHHKNIFRYNQRFRHDQKFKHCQKLLHNRQALHNQQPSFNQKAQHHKKTPQHYNRQFRRYRLYLKMWLNPKLQSLPFPTD